MEIEHENTNNQSLSESEQMYLATIARLQASGQNAPLALALLAEELAVLPVSANQMIRKLEKAGLVVYTPYKGVDLTPTGAEEAGRILRHRQLWETFLVDHLRYTPGEAAPLACRLEHILPAEAAERLATYLANLAESPDHAAEALQQTALPLSQTRLNDCGAVAEITADSITRSFLNLQGIHSGALLTVLATSGPELLVETDNRQMVRLSSKIADTIWLVSGESPCKSA